MEGAAVAAINQPSPTSGKLSVLSLPGCVLFVDTPKKGVSKVANFFMGAVATCNLLIAACRTVCPSSHLNGKLTVSCGRVGCYSL